MAAPTLPPRFYWTLDSLAHRYQVTPEEIAYYFDTGLVWPSALIPRARIADVCPAGASPHVCVLLPDYRDLQWRHTDGGSFAELVGDYRAFSANGSAYESCFLTFAEPVTIARSELVITDGQLEGLQAEAEKPAAKKHSRRERTLLKVIAALLRDDDRGDYTVARWLQVGLDISGMPLAQETVASVVRDARAEASQLGSMEGARAPIAA